MIPTWRMGSDGCLALCYDDRKFGFNWVYAKRVEFLHDSVAVIARKKE